MGRTSVITRSRAKDVVKAIVVEPTSHDVLDSTAQNKMGVITRRRAIDLAKSIVVLEPSYRVYYNIQ